MIHDLYLINDHINSFDTVCDVIIKNVHDNPIQAEQICMITHNIGKCHLLKGDNIVTISQLKDVLESEGLIVELESSTSYT